MKTQLAIIALTILPFAADAHERSSDPLAWKYDKACCTSVVPSESQGDCAPIPETAVVAVPGGYEVTLNPGDHPWIKTTQHYFVPHDRPMYPGSIEPAVRPSGDDDWHACLFPDEATLRCLYIRYGGT